MKNTYSIKNDVLEDLNTNKVFEILSVIPEGIVIRTESDNGAEITKTISWKEIKR